MAPTDMKKTGIMPPAPGPVIGRDVLIRRMVERYETHLRNWPPKEGAMAVDGSAMRKLREHADLSVQVLADKAKCSATLIRNAENGHAIRSESIKMIATALGTSPEKLIEVPHSKLITVLYGIAGMGKTTVCQKLVWDRDIQRALFPDGVLWAPLGRDPIIADILMAWSRALGIELSMADAPLNLIRGMLQATLEDKRLLILLDDAWDASHVRSLDVAGLLSPVLVTTRSPNVAFHVASEPAKDVYKLEQLSDTDALAVLNLSAAHILQSCGEEEALRFASAFQGHPLILQVAGRLLASQAAGIDDPSYLLRRINQVRTLLPREAPTMDGQSLTINAVLSLSTDKDVLGDVPRACFARLAPFDPKPSVFNVNDLATAWNDMNVSMEEMATLLAGRGLIESVGRGQYSIHPLLSAHAFWISSEM